MKFILDVTQEDIDNGVQKNASFCPIARACMRALPAVIHEDDKWSLPATLEVEIEDCINVNFEGGNFGRRYFRYGNQDILNFILNFDENRESVAPFSKEIELYETTEDMMSGEEI